MSTKYVYSFADGKADGKADMRNLLGGKGANLHEMTNLGLPVPAGFTLSTDVCTYFYAHGRQYPPDEQIGMPVGSALYFCRGRSLLCAGKCHQY